MLVCAGAALLLKNGKCRFVFCLSCVASCPHQCRLTMLITFITVDDTKSMHASGFESRNISLYAICYYMQLLLTRIKLV